MKTNTKIYEKDNYDSIYKDLLKVIKNVVRIKEVSYESNMIKVTYDSVVSNNFNYIKYDSTVSDEIFEKYCKIIDFSRKYYIFFVYGSSKFNSLYNDDFYKVSKTLIQLSRLDAVVLLNSKEMLNLKLSMKEQQESNNINLDDLQEKNIRENFDNIRKVELMGCYVKIKSDQISDKYPIFSKFDKNILDNLKEHNSILNFIFICPENIRYFIDNIRNIKYKEILTEDKLFSIVFAHELGHLVFAEDPYISMKISERQANLGASYLHNGIYDKEIDIITKHQLLEYQNPLLISQRYKNHDKFKAELNKLYGV